MGNSLHNKIYLGRRPAVLSNKAMQALMVLAGAVAGASLVWLMIYAFL
ncbi:MAG TPA: hypothetical protein VGP06_08475 [Janthinobacterium sp.]|jgi:hypothetical protein|nr:hypothetical protein [Janthinobacterium sp.]